tara:strand:+ start:921 stop:2435 length:1515 start_codon:yes stop_codon:yes gene_type:complete
MLALFPDGPPSEEIRDAILKDEGIAGEVMAEITKVDTDRALHIEMPAGTRIDATRQGSNSWRFEIASAKAPGGERVRLKFTVTGTDKFDSSKVDMHLAMAAVSGDMLNVKRQLKELIYRYGDGTVDGGRYDEMPEAFRAAYEAMTSPIELRFDTLYGVMNRAFKDDNVVDFSYLDGVDLETHKCQSISNFEGRWFGDFTQPLVINRIRAVLACIAMHEISWEHYTGDLMRYEEEMETIMAKNTGGSRWYYISGNRKNVNKIANSFTHSGIFHVLADTESMYVYIQEREWKFLSGIVKDNSCRVKECDEPVYGVTKCGKNHMKPGIHSRKCNACKRAESNEARATESKPSGVVEESQPAIEPVPTGRVGHSSSVRPVTGKVSGLRPAPQLTAKQIEDREIAKRHGPVITVEGPKEVAEDDYEAMAKENRRVADELLARASYYEKIAEHYEALLNPTPAVQEAEAALAEAVKKAQDILDAAKAQAEADRTDQKVALKALIDDGPPV